VNRRLLISAAPGETRAAWMEDGRLADLVVQRDDRPSRLGDIFLGRVAKVDKGLDAAFVELGLSRPGLLPLGEAPKRRLSEGDAVVVRVLREAAGSKGVRLSARIHSPPPGLEQSARDNKPPALLVRGDDPIDRMLAARQAPEEIVIDDPAAFAEAKRRLAGQGEELIGRVKLDLDPASLFEREGVEAEIETLLRPRVALPSGGFLLIEPVATLTAVDVNSGGHGPVSQQALAVNLEAAAEIPRQLRLRALSGLIVIDFLTLEEGRFRKRVVTALLGGLKHDPEPTRVFPMAASGLVEMTRRRGRPALHELMTEACGIDGSGRLKDPVTLAFEALRAARREATAWPGAGLAIRAAPAVIAALEGPVSAARLALEQRLGRPLALATSTGGPGEAPEVAATP